MDNMENTPNTNFKTMKFEIFYSSKETLGDKLWEYRTPNTICHLEYVMEEFVNFCINSNLHEVNVTSVDFWDVCNNK